LIAFGNSKKKDLAGLTKKQSETTRMSDSDDEAPLLEDLNQEALSDVEVPLLLDLKQEEPDRAQAVVPTVLDDDAELPQCPVTILSGFLGSGKTTLVQYILRSPNHKKRIAVIENEFGGGQGLAVESLIARDGVDPDDNNLSDLIELPNGCVCCTVKDSLVATLENLVTKRKDLDYILIEASGMANPGKSFWHINISSF
jgi:hypothetical protein